MKEGYLKMINYSLRFLSFYACIAIILSIIHGVSFAEQKKGAREPVTITSQILTADNKANIAIFEGSVKAVKGDIILYADKMTVYYQDEKAGTSSIRKIDAEGNIKLIRGDRVVASGFAQYFSETEEKVVFTGEPKATDGESVITGSKMTYFFRNDRYVVENSKVFMRNEAQKSQRKKD